MVAVFRILFHEPAKDLAKPLRHVGPEDLDRRRWVLLMLQELLHHGAVGKGGPAHEHEKNRASERVEVAADVGRPWVAGLFGRDVVEGAERHAADGEILVAGHVVQPCQAHVDDAGAAGGRDDDVRWLDVAVDDVSLGGMLECVGHLDRHIDRAGHVEGPFVRDHIAEVGALDEFEDDVVPAVVGTDRVHAADIFVVEAGGRLGFVAKPLKHVLVVRLLPRQHLDGDDSVEGGVEGAEDGAHAAAADELVEPVGAEEVPLEQSADLGRGGRFAGSRRPAGNDGGVAHGHGGCGGCIGTDGDRRVARHTGRSFHGIDPNRLPRRGSNRHPIAKSLGNEA